MNDLRADQFVKSELLSITKTYVCIPICGTRRKLTVATTVPQRLRLRPRHPSDKFSKWFFGYSKSNRSRSARAPWKLRGYRPSRSQARAAGNKSVDPIGVISAPTVLTNHLSRF